MVAIPTIGINASTATVFVAPGETVSLNLGSLYVFLPGDVDLIGALLRFPGGGPTGLDGAIDHVGAKDYPVAGDVSSLVDPVAFVTTYTFTNNTTSPVSVASIAASLLGSANLQYDYNTPQGAFVADGIRTSDLIAANRTPTIAIADAAPVYETANGTEQAKFIVTLTGAEPNDTVTVHYGTQDGTAKAGSDYSAENGTLTFAPGQTTATISIPVIGAQLAQHNETFTVVLSNPTDSSGTTPIIGKSTGTGTIDALFTTGTDVVNFNSLQPNQITAIQKGADLYNGLIGRLRWRR